MSQCILFAEDDEDFVFLIRCALDKTGMKLPIQFVHDGVEAVSYLNGDGDYVDRLKHPLPAALVLDIRMPLMDGFEVLEWVRKNPAVQFMPTIMLTSSQEPDEIKRAYTLRANSYLIKPMEFDGLVEIIATLIRYWSEVNFPPPPDVGGYVIPEVRRF